MKRRLRQAFANNNTGTVSEVLHHMSDHAGFDANDFMEMVFYYGQNGDDDDDDDDGEDEEHFYMQGDEVDEEADDDYEDEEYEDDIEMDEDNENEVDKGDSRVEEGDDDDDEDDNGFEDPMIAIEDNSAPHLNENESVRNEGYNLAETRSVSHDYDSHEYFDTTAAADAASDDSSI